MYPSKTQSESTKTTTNWKRKQTACWEHLNRKTKQINLSNDMSKTPKLQNMNYQLCKHVQIKCSLL